MTPSPLSFEIQSPSLSLLSPPALAGEMSERGIVGSSSNTRMSRFVFEHSDVDPAGVQDPLAKPGMTTRMLIQEDVRTLGQAGVTLKAFAGRKLGLGWS